MIAVTSNNYYVDEYARLMNRIALRDEEIDVLVDNITSKLSSSKTDNKKQIAVVAAAAAVLAIGVKFFLDVNKKAN